MINLWLAAGAFGWAVFGWLNLLSPDLILLCVFIIGAGFAFNAPTWTSVVAQVVPERDLASVATFISAIPAVVPIIGLKVFHFNSSDLGLLFTSLGIHSETSGTTILRTEVGAGDPASN